jgi:hypothetical protein
MAMSACAGYKSCAGTLNSDLKWGLKVLGLARAWKFIRRSQKERLRPKTGQRRSAKLLSAETRARVCIGQMVARLMSAMQVHPHKR